MDNNKMAEVLKLTNELAAKAIELNPELAAQSAQAYALIVIACELHRMNATLKLLVKEESK